VNLAKQFGKAGSKAQPFYQGAQALEVQAIYRGVIVGTRHLYDSGQHEYVIGSRKHVDAPAAAAFAIDGSHALVSLVGDEFIVNVTSQMQGDVTDVLFETDVDAPSIRRRCQSTSSNPIPISSTS
jgi:hypothetical protein